MLFQLLEGENSLQLSTQVADELTPRSSLAALPLVDGIYVVPLVYLVHYYISHTTLVSVIDILVFRIGSLLEVHCLDLYYSEVFRLAIWWWLFWVWLSKTRVLC